MSKINILVSLLIVYSLHFAGAEKLKVSIYYESLCPHSISLITRQLYPGYTKIGDYLEVDFVPYGKATQTIENGEWKFECQHGSWECYGNKLQVCALNQNKKQDANVEFINCVMGSNDPAWDKYVEKCANDNNFSWNKITDCKSSSEGSEILAQYGDRTHGVIPKITFVPTIMFNDVYDANLQNGAQTNFLKTACGLLKEKPDVCL